MEWLELFNYVTSKYDDNSMSPSEIKLLYEMDIIQFFRLLVAQEKNNIRIKKNIDKQKAAAERKRR